MAIKFTSVVDVSNNKIINVGSPTANTDAANKVYVDNVAQGLTWKEAARAASTGNVSLTTPGATLDGVTLATGDRLLLKNQTAGAENGIYVFDTAGTALVRTIDFNTSAKVTPGSALSVAEGSVNVDSTYVLVTDNPITLGTSLLVFSLMNGGSGPTYTAGNGVALTTGVLSVTPAPSGGLLVAAGGVSVDPTVVVRKFAMNLGDGVTTSITVPHLLNTLDVTIEVFVNSAPYDSVYAEVQRTDVNNAVVVFGAAPAAAEYRVVVHG